jgi:hypothetical protein
MHKYIIALEKPFSLLAIGAFKGLRVGVVKGLNNVICGDVKFAKMGEHSQLDDDDVDGVTRFREIAHKPVLSDEVRRAEKPAAICV